VVLISVDTLRSDHLGLYGYDRPTSPFLEELAGDGVVFETFVHNGGSTLPSHMTMMTSLHPEVHGVESSAGRILDPAEVTLAEALRSAGLTTAAFVDAGWMKGRFGFQQGFDLYDDRGGRLSAMLPRALDWLERKRDRRFFLFLHTYDVHSQWDRLPYDCPAEFRDLYTEGLEVDFDGCRDGVCASRRLALWNSELTAGELEIAELASEIEYMRALYDGCINYVDSQLESLVEGLRSLGLYDRTLIVVTSDHGEEFGDHGYFLHAERAYEEIARIPLVMKLPESAVRGIRLPYLAAMVDLQPTILDVLGLPATPRAQGRSLLPVIDGPEEARTEVHLEASVRTRRWKLLGEVRQLYDLEDDPGETRNLFSEEKDVAYRLAALLEELERRNGELLAGRPEAGGEPGDLAITPEEKRQLEALGYLD
jgi:arylsulfatase A-like enzyme